MYTLIYTTTGRILMTTSETGIGSVSAIEAEIPDGFYAESINPETKEPVLKEIPKTEEQKKLADLETKQAEDDERIHRSGISPDALGTGVGRYGDDNRTVTDRSCPVASYKQVTSKLVAKRWH